MPVLCLDTATTSIVVALMDPSSDLIRGTSREGRAQGLLELVDEVLADLDRSSITAVVVGVGPGGFTGLRVGVATARGIGEALGVPVYGVDSLLATVARDAAASRGALVWAVVDARRGEHFMQPWCSDPDGNVVAAAPLLVTPSDDVGAIVGDMPRSRAAGPTPESLARAAAQVLATATADGDPLAVIPHYGRDPDAQPRRIDVTLDALALEDLDRLVILERRCFRTPWSRAACEQELRRPASDSVCLAARDGVALVGAAIVARLADWWHVMDVLVDPAARRQGIASRLVAEMLNRTTQLGAGEGWTLEVRAGNDAAVHLYERHGFERLGVRRGYYADTGEDAIVMSRPASVAIGDAGAAATSGAGGS